MEDQEYQQLLTEHQLLLLEEEELLAIGRSTDAGTIALRVHSHYSENETLMFLASQSECFCEFPRTHLLEPILCVIIDRVLVLTHAYCTVTLMSTLTSSEQALMAYSDGASRGLGTDQEQYYTKVTLTVGVGPRLGKRHSVPSWRPRKMQK